MQRVALGCLRSSTSPAAQAQQKAEQLAQQSSDAWLALALERMGTNQIEILPVVKRAEVHKLKGIVKLQNVLEAYGVSRALWYAFRRRIQFASTFIYAA